MSRAQEDLELREVENGVAGIEGASDIMDAESVCEDYPLAYPDVDECDNEELEYGKNESSEEEEEGAQEELYRGDIPEEPESLGIMYVTMSNNPKLNIPGAADSPYDPHHLPPPYAPNRCQTTVPVEKKWNRTYSFTWSERLIVALTFVNSLYYYSVYMSLQSFWYVIAPGMEKHFGIVWAILDFGRIIGHFLTLFIFNRYGVRVACLNGLILGTIGSCLYGLSMFTGGTKVTDGSLSVGTYQLLYIARLLMGISSGSIIAGPLYFSKTLLIEYRGPALLMCKLAELVAFVLGTSYPIAFTATFSDNVDYGDDLEMVFNLYTIPTWLNTFISASCIPLVILFMENPKVAKRRITGKNLFGARVKKVYKELQPGKYSWETSKDIRYQAFCLCSTVFVLNVFFASVSTNMFSLAVRYQVVSSANELGLIGVSVTAIVVVCGLYMSRVKNHLSLVWGLAIANSAAFQLLDYGVPHGSSFQFYFGTLSVTLGDLLTTMIVGQFYMKQMSYYMDQGGDKIQTFVSLIGLAGIFGKAIGSLIFGYSLAVEVSSDDELAARGFNFTLSLNNATYLTDFYSQNKDLCVLRFPSNFQTDGCRLIAVNGTFISMIVFCISFSFILGAYMHNNDILGFPADIYFGNLGEKKSEFFDVGETCNTKETAEENEFDLLDKIECPDCTDRSCKRCKKRRKALKKIQRFRDRPVVQHSFYEPYMSPLNFYFVGPDDFNYRYNRDFRVHDIDYSGHHDRSKKDSVADIVSLS
eukprot:Nk52_evm63s1020 gene=Nk52_evmTU63s1020